MNIFRAQVIHSAPAVPKLKLPLKGGIKRLMENVYLCFLRIAQPKISGCAIRLRNRDEGKRMETKKRPAR